MIDRKVIESLKTLKNYCKENETCANCPTEDICHRGWNTYPEDWEIYENEDYEKFLKAAKTMKTLCSEQPGNCGEDGVCNCGEDGFCPYEKICHEVRNPIPEDWQLDDVLDDESENQDIKDLTAKVIELEKEKAELNGQVVEYEETEELYRAAIKDYKTTLNDYRERFKEYALKNAKLDKENAGLKDEIETLRNEQQGTQWYRNEIENLKKENEHYRNELLKSVSREHLIAVIKGRLGEETLRYLAPEFVITAEEIKAYNKKWGANIDYCYFETGKEL